MADLVENIMETMLPDMLSLMKRNVFTKKEVRQILKARRDAEYTFLRKNSTKKDYLKAIQYEYELERRRRKKFKELKLKKQTQKDFSIIKRIIFIFDRLTAKYRYNIEIWKEYCLFCYKIKSNKMFNKAVSQALQFNHRNLEIWLLAVYYQFEMNNNPFKARKIFLKAIKLNPDNQEFWLEYFRFELKFIETYKLRKAILQSGARDKSTDAVEGIEEEKKHKEEPKKKLAQEDFIEFEDEDKLVEENAKKKSQESQETLVIVESAKNKFADDSNLPARFLKICNEFHGEWILKLRDNLYQSILKDNWKYPKTVLAGIIHYERVYTSLENHINDEKLLADVLEKVIAKIKDYFDYLRSLEESENQILQMKLHIVNDFILQLAILTKKNNSEAQSVSPSVIMKTAALFIENMEAISEFINDSPYIISSLSKLVKVTKILPKPIKTILLATFEKNKEDLVVSFKVLGALMVSDKSLQSNLLDIKEYIESLLSSKTLQLIPKQRFKLLQWKIKLPEYLDQSEKEIIADLKYSIKYILPTRYFVEFTTNYLERLIADKGFDSNLAKESFKYLFELQNMCPSDVLKLYLDNLRKIENPALAKKFYLKSVELYPANKNFWLEYINWEKNFGNPLACQDIFLRAQKYIKEETFIQEYIDLMQSTS